MFLEDNVFNVVLYLVFVINFYVCEVVVCIYFVLYFLDLVLVRESFLFDIVKCYF